jgi:hypothetical protein
LIDLLASINGRTLSVNVESMREQLGDGQTLSVNEVDLHTTCHTYTDVEINGDISLSIEDEAFVFDQSYNATCDQD